MAGSGIFDVLNDTTPFPGWGLVVVTGVFAAAVSTTTFVFLVTGSQKLLTRVNVLGTVVHEGGHAFVGIVTGGEVYQIQITSADSGRIWYGHPSRFSRILATAAGYAMPPLAGLGAAALLHRGLVPAVLALTSLIMLLVLLAARDLLTVAAVLVLGAIAFATLRWGPAWLQNGVAYTEVWLLLTSEIGGLGAIITNRIHGGYHGHADDATHLAEDTPIPAFVWIISWLALIGWSVWNAVPLLWP